MENMYAPWRIAFIEGRKKDDLPSPSGCIFCDYTPNHCPENHSREEWDKRRLIVTARKHAFVILNKYPYANGHIMVVPRRHTDQLDSLHEEMFQDTHLLLQEAIAAIRKIYAPHGINIGMNMGRAAGAGIADHVHYHIVPRWNGDTNFMPTFAGVKVINEGLNDTYERLVPLLRQPNEK